MALRRIGDKPLSKSMIAIICARGPGHLVEVTSFYFCSIALSRQLSACVRVATLGHVTRMSCWRVSCNDWWRWHFTRQKVRWKILLSKKVAIGFRFHRRDRNVFIRSLPFQKEICLCTISFAIGAIICCFHYDKNASNDDKFGIMTTLNFQWLKCVGFLYDDVGLNMWTYGATVVLLSVIFVLKWRCIHTHSQHCTADGLVLTVLAM